MVRLMESKRLHTCCKKYGRKAWADERLMRIAPIVVDAPTPLVGAETDSGKRVLRPSDAADASEKNSGAKQLGDDTRKLLWLRACCDDGAEDIAIFYEYFYMLVGLGGYGQAYVIECYREALVGALDEGEGFDFGGAEW